MKPGIERYFRFDWTLLFAAVTLTVIGLLAIYGIGISQDANNLFQFKKQIIAIFIGFVIVFASAFIDYRQVKSFALIIYGVGLFLLTTVLVIGSTHKGAGRWFSLGSLSFQPVEISKVFLAVFLAAYLSRHAHKRLGWVPFIGSAAATGLYVLLIMLQPDFGSAIVLIIIWLAAVLFAGLPRRAWLVFIGAAVVILPLLWMFGLKPYQRDRITSFVNPAADPRGAGYNVKQARIAIGSGGWLGKGIGEGSQSRLRFLPEASTDFIFSVVGEELGFVGITIVLLLFGLLVFRFLRVAMLSGDPFAELLLVMLAAMVMFHVLVNAGMNLGVMPVTGIPLPFVSGAASAVIVAYIAVALAQSVAVRN